MLFLSRFLLVVMLPLSSIKKNEIKFFLAKVSNGAHAANISDFSQYPSNHIGDSSYSYWYLFAFMPWL
ncbi:MAG: hypothetical protein A3H01_02340 [Candidatus Wildermuthbacteria bacterium RIFCSPLOWO2_12_FULL_40_9]|uniref:Uncharacterized protein n=2 Tax=Candidatus Wildermuthiibacteriota TaxID=1817923 RepID=A0A1G2RE18_9BACT|nr:MAG: hypothetical protein A3F15_02885 [Candidatus Wildermuthbacteria bacterium RIFCSPHIGHO2_12_FULL_40_12]OHA76932.1 MAG: hypothetical protein A3H01_02340 [Candidatus Wildermuthbacteria bacterium RIFCSPLOWO2_12_FULL_40_9]